MAGFHLYRSASTQALAQKLVSVVTAADGQLPLDQDEVIVVQGRGMEQWLSRMVAAKLGVWAGAQFPFPRAAAAELTARVLREPVPARVSDDALTLAFAVAAELPALMATPQGERVRRYVGDDGARLLSFAEQVAHVLDGYAVFRPQWVEAWEAGKLADLPREMPDEVWQAALWRALSTRATTHVALESIVSFWPRIRRATQAIAAGTAATPLTRVSVFAVAGVPPQMVEFFAELGRVSDVHWYAVDPSADTPGSPAVTVEELGRADLEAVSIVRDHVVRAASVGIAARDEPLQHKETGNADSLLARLQEHVRTAKPLRTGALDRSLRVHGCPGKQREAEVLHDELLRAFDELPGLTLEDIVVLVPDIAAYAPAIEAVLRSGRGLGALDSSVADVSERDGSSMAVAFGTALALADGDMGVSSVMDLLSQPMVAERLLPSGVAPADISRWLTRAGARRFLDAEHREAAGLPRTAEGTWDLAFTRLCAGLAAPPGSVDAEPMSGIVPAQPFLLSASAIGQLSRCVDLLQHLRAIATVERTRTLGEWMAALQGVVAALAPAHGEGEQQARTLLQELTAVADAARAAGLDAQFSFDAVRALLQQRIARSRPGRGFMSGGITVCQFVPMRSVPFRLVCMMGMDDQAFPRNARRPGFDLMAADHRAGDRDARAEDRALFLQSVLAARDRVVITFDGRSLASGSERAPSTAVSQLMDVTGLSVIKHPLHSFSVGAFNAQAVSDDRLGYDAEAGRAAAKLQDGAVERTARPFLRHVPGASRPPQDTQRTVTAEELARFFRDPAKATLKEWGVRLPRDESEVPDLELVGLDSGEAGLLRWGVLDRAMKSHGAIHPDELARLRQNGELPIGEPGRQMGAAILSEVSAGMNDAYGGRVAVRSVQAEIDGWHLVGQVPMVDGRVVLLASGGVRTHHRLHGQVLQWLVAVCDGQAQEGLVKALSSNAGRHTLEAVNDSDARKRLQRLLALREFGLSNALPCVGEVSDWAAEQFEKGIPEEDVIEEAQDKLEDSDQYSDHARLLFRGTDLVRAEFGTLNGFGPVNFFTVARAVYGSAVFP